MGLYKNVKLLSKGNDQWNEERTYRMGKIVPAIPQIKKLIFRIYIELKNARTLKVKPQTKGVQLKINRYFAEEVHLLSLEKCKLK